MFPFVSPSFKRPAGKIDSGYRSSLPRYFPKHLCWRKQVKFSWCCINVSFMTHNSCPNFEHGRSYRLCSPIRSTHLEKRWIYSRASKALGGSSRGTGNINSKLVKETQALKPPVTPYFIPLPNPVDANAPISLLQVATDKQLYEVMNSDIFKALLDFKWKMYGKTIFQTQFLIYFIFCVLFGYVMLAYWVTMVEYGLVSELKIQHLLLSQKFTRVCQVLPFEFSVEFYQ